VCDYLGVVPRGEYGLFYELLDRVEIKNAIQWTTPILKLIKGEEIVFVIDIERKRLYYPAYLYEILKETYHYDDHKIFQVMQEMVEGFLDDSRNGVCEQYDLKDLYQIVRSEKLPTGLDSDTFIL
jgi:hypothetical protein